MAALPTRPTLLVLAIPCLAKAEDPKLSRAEIARWGMAATALVDVKRHGTGSTFCVHPSGLFITNHHVIGADDAQVSLVLNSGVADLKVLAAKVVRSNQARDLALLRTDGVKGLPALPIVPADGLLMQRGESITLYRVDGTEVPAKNFYLKPTDTLAEGLVTDDGRDIQCEDEQGGVFRFRDTQEKLYLNNPMAVGYSPTSSSRRSSITCRCTARSRSWPATAGTCCARRSVTNCRSAANS